MKVAFGCVIGRSLSEERLRRGAIREILKVQKNLKQHATLAGTPR
jgi:hypothetical protein